MNIRNNHIRKRLGGVYDSKGVLQTSRQGIVDAFAEFYEKLYDDAPQDVGREDCPTESREAKRREATPRITTEEIRSQLK